MKKKSPTKVLFKSFSIFALFLFFSLNLSAQDFSSPQAFSSSIENLDPDLQAIVLEATFFSNIAQSELQDLANIASDKKEVSSFRESMDLHKRIDPWMDRNLTPAQKSSIMGNSQMKRN